MTGLRQVERAPGVRAPKLPPDHLSIHEVYFSIQGECAWVGTPTVFVRTSHCPLRCVWCDSQFTFVHGESWTLERILAEVAKHPTKHVCLTGGEPLAQPASFDLCEDLAERGYTVEVETSGSESTEPFHRMAPRIRERITVNLDVKCPGSAMSKLNLRSNWDLLLPHDQVKFILADRADYEWAREVVRGRSWPCPLWLHPAWDRLDPRSLVDWVKQDGLPVRVGVQAHKYIWGDARGV